MVDDGADGSASPRHTTPDTTGDPPLVLHTAFACWVTSTAGASDFFLESKRVWGPYGSGRVWPVFCESPLVALAEELLGDSNR